MADLPAPRAMGSRDVLRIPDFRRLFLAQAISDIGDGMTYLALYLLVLDLTASTAAIALISILVAVPPVTIGLFAGAYADRLDRRRIMLASDTLRAALVLSLVVFGGPATLPVVFVLAFLQAVVGTFFSPARAALVPRVVPPEGLLAANTLNQVSRVVGNVVGVAFTGAVAGAAGVVWPAFVLDALTFLASVAIVFTVSREAGRIQDDAASAARERGLRGSVADGLRVIGRSRPLVATLGGVAVTMLGLGAINVLFVPFVFRDLGANPAWAGPIEGAQSLSMVLASGLVVGLSARFRVSSLFVGGLVGVAVCVGALAFAANVWMVLGAMFAVGWFVTPVHATTMTIVQQSTTDAVRGRVSGALNAVIQTATIVSMAAAGILAAVVGVRLVFLAGGIIAGLAALLAWLLFRGVAEPAAEAQPASAHASGHASATSIGDAGASAAGAGPGDALPAA
jgi:MFS family permease